MTDIETYQLPKDKRLLFTRKKKHTPRAAELLAVVIIGLCVVGYMWQTHDVRISVQAKK